MKVGIISDTHNNLRAVDKALKYLNKKKISLLIHCGDWEMPFTMRVYTQVKCPIKAVLGNGDPDIQKFQYQLQNLDVLKGMDLDIQPELQDFVFDGKRFAVFHGDDHNVNKALVESQMFDVFCVGHNHQPKIEEKGKTLIINPGSFVGFFMEEGGVVPRTLALYDTVKNSAEIINLDKLFKNLLD